MDIPFDQTTERSRRIGLQEKPGVVLALTRSSPEAEEFSVFVFREVLLRDAVSLVNERLPTAVAFKWMTALLYSKARTRKVTCVGLCSNKQACDQELCWCVDGRCTPMKETIEL